MSTSPIEKRTRGVAAPGLAGLLVLAILGAGAAALVARTGSRPLARGPAAAEPAAGVVDEARPLTAPAADAERTRGVPGLAAEVEPELVAPAAPRTEREFLAAFRALSARSPGALEACAEAILDGPGPDAEKVALLRALREGASAERLAWQEHAARTGSTAPSSGALGLADVALEFLAADAAREPEAAQALARLAFATPGLDAGLRRRAAVGFARHGDEPGLAQLEAQLAWETDELLVAGVLGALAERAPSAARSRLLLAHGRGDERRETVPLE